MFEYLAVAIAGDLGVARDANQMVLGSSGGSHSGIIIDFIKIDFIRVDLGSKEID